MFSELTPWRNTVHFPLLTKHRLVEIIRLTKFRAAAAGAELGIVQCFWWYERIFNRRFLWEFHFFWGNNGYKYFLGVSQFVTRLLLQRNVSKVECKRSLRSEFWVEAWGGLVRCGQCFGKWFYLRWRLTKIEMQGLKITPLWIIHFLFKCIIYNFSSNYNVRE